MPDASVDAGPACSFAVSYAQGYPCNTNADCSTGLCYFPIPLFGDESVPGYCTTSCGAGGTCPTSYGCVAQSDGGSLCTLTDAGMTLPQNGTLPFGSPCRFDQDCAGTAASCGFVDNGNGTEFTFCTSTCNTSTPTTCGPCGLCTTPQGGGSDQCQPNGGRNIGTPCTERSDCTSFDCQGFCTVQCAGGGIAPVSCPSGTECQPAPIATDATQALCVQPDQIGGTPIGEPCTYDFQCAQGGTCHIASGATAGECQTASALGATCATDEDCGSPLVCRTIAPGLRAANGEPAPDPLACTEACQQDSDCGDGGSCVAVDLDTNLLVWASDESTLIASDSEYNPIFGDRWSRLTWTFAAGTYYVDVSAYNQSQGTYMLWIGPSGPPQSVTRQTTGNNSFSTAQRITPPITVMGGFAGPNESDFYSFKLTSTETLTISIQQGAPSLCLPSSEVAQVPWGSTCTTDWECQSNLCEQALQVCGKTCTENSDCEGINPPPDAGPVDGGEGDAGIPDSGPQPICADFVTHQSCIMAGTYGTLAAGSFCDYSFQCVDGYCADFCGSVFCTQPCSGYGANCGVEGDQNECAPMTTAPSLDPVSGFACTPTNEGLCDAGASCAGTGDCQPSLTCSSTNHTCEH